jgi:Ca2+-binding RTX toxin-like protein
VLVSGRGADLLEGGDGNDELHEIGEDGATNILRGGNGDDLLRVFDNYGANTLEGGAGNDVLIVGNSLESGEVGPQNMQMGGEDNFSRFVLDGGAGDDAYFILGHESAEELKVVDSGGNDTIYLVNGEDSLREILGSDFVDNEDSAGTVHPALDMDFFTMAAGIENLYADGLNDGEDGNGVNAMYLVGNASDNLIVGTDDRDVLIGGAGNDTLEGGASADDLVGGAGNDLYILGDIFGSSANDTVIEAANEGTDTVWAYQSYKLENNVEHLRLFGWEDLRGTGNALDNSLTGNGGDNVLSGGFGNDVLDGGAGATGSTAAPASTGSTAAAAGTS